MDTREILNTKGIEDFFDIVKCKICLQLSLTPVTCKKCESVFCKECIENWRLKSNTCPLRCCDRIELNEEPRVIKSMLSKFFYKCLKCLNEISAGDYTTHKKICTEDLMTCENGCGQLVKLMYLETHYKLVCPNAVVKCIKCDSSVKRNELKENISKETNYRILELEKELNRKDEIIHQLKSERMTQIHNNINTNINVDIVRNNNPDLESVESYKIQFYNTRIKEIAKLDLKNILALNTNNLISVSFIEYFQLNEIDYIALAITTGDIIFYDVSNNSCAKTIKVHTDNFTDFKYIKSNQDFIITSSFDSTIVSFSPHDLLTNLINPFRKRNLDAPCTCLLINDNKDILVVADVSGSIQLLQFENYGIILSRKIHKSRIMCMEYVDQEHLISFSKDKTLIITNLSNFEVIKTFSLDYTITSLITIKRTNLIYISDDKGNIYTYGNNDSNLKLKYKSTLNTNSNNKLYTISINNKVDLLFSFSQLNGIKFLWCKNDNVEFFLEKKIEDITAFNIPAIQKKIAFSPDGFPEIKLLENYTVTRMEDINYGIIYRKNGVTSMFQLNRDYEYSN